MLLQVQLYSELGSVTQKRTSNMGGLPRAYVTQQAQYLLRDSSRISCPNLRDFDFPWFNCL